MQRFRPLVLVMVLVGLLLTAGCGNGGSDASVSAGSPAPAGSVLTRFTLLPRAVPSIITQFRFFFFDANGQVVAGPILAPKAATVTLSGIPVAATSMRIEYLQGTTLRGLGTVPVALTAGATVEVVDPPFQDVGSQVQAVEVTPAEAVLPAGVTRQYAATALFFDGTTQDVTSSALWTSSDEGVATVGNAPDNPGLVAASAAGGATIAADFGGVSGSGDLTVTAATLQSLSVAPAQAVLARGTTQAFTAWGLFTDGSTSDLTSQVTWTTSDGSLVTVDAGGVATGVAQGQASVVATHPATGLSDSAAVTVTAAVLQQINVTPFEDTVPVGVSEQYQATGLFSDGSNQDLTSVVAWTTADPAVATISNAVGEKGLARGVGVGATDVSAQMPGSAVVGTAHLRVTAATLESLEVFPPGQVIGDGQTQQYTAVGTYTDSSTEDLTGQVTWSSGSPAVASVSNASGSKGLARALSQGQAEIRATHPGTGIHGATTLTVGAAILQSMAVTPVDETVPAGVEVQYVAMGSFSDGSSRNLTSLVAWSSSVDTVASISNGAGTNGLATAHAVGATTIAATLSGVTGSTGLQVTGAALVSLQVTPVDPSLPVGMQRRFTAVGTYSDASTEDLTAEVTWTSSDPLRATISNAPGEEGTATARSVGVAVVTARMPGTALSGTSNLSVTSAVLQSLTVTPADHTVGIVHFVAYTATGNFSDGSTLDLTSAVTWRSSRTLVAVISNTSLAKGIALSVLPGTTTISARLPNSTVIGSTTLNVQ